MLAKNKTSAEAHSLKLVAVQAAAPPAVAAAVVLSAQSAAAAVDLDESATRALIDAQLRAAGWEADAQTLPYAKSARSTPNRNLAIAE